MLAADNVVQEQLSGRCPKNAGTAMNGDKLVNNGGRVLGVTALGQTIADAQRLAYQAAEKIHWEGCYYRRDIASKAIG